jgi:hypothetical protein
VIVVNQTLQVRGSADVWMVGRVFNRGLKPARNVRVVPLLTNLYGSRLPTIPFISTRPTCRRRASQTFRRVSDRRWMFAR